LFYPDETGLVATEMKAMLSKVLCFKFTSYIYKP